MKFTGHGGTGHLPYGNPACADPAEGLRTAPATTAPGGSMVAHWRPPSSGKTAGSCTGCFHTQTRRKNRCRPRQKIPKYTVFPGIPCLAGSGFNPQTCTLPLTGPLHTKSSRMGEKMSSRIPSSRQVQPWGTPFSFKRVSPARTVRVSPSMVKENAPETT